MDDKDKRMSKRPGPLAVGDLVVVKAHVFSFSSDAYTTIPYRYMLHRPEREDSFEDITFEENTHALVIETCDFPVPQDADYEKWEQSVTVLVPSCHKIVYKRSWYYSTRSNNRIEKLIAAGCTGAFR